MVRFTISEVSQGIYEAASAFQGVVTEDFSAHRSRIGTCDLCIYKKEDSCNDKNDFTKMKKITNNLISHGKGGKDGRQTHRNVKLRGLSCKVQPC